MSITVLHLGASHLLLPVSICNLRNSYGEEMRTCWTERGRGWRESEFFFVARLCHRNLNCRLRVGRVNTRFGITSNDQIETLIGQILCLYNRWCWCARDCCLSWPIIEFVWYSFITIFIECMKGHTYESETLSCKGVSFLAARAHQMAVALAAMHRVAITTPQ